MSAEAQAWLAARAADVPASLAQRMKEAAGDVVASDGASMPALLGEAALVCLRDALPRCDERTAALHLLAADALITYACEAAAEEPGHGGPSGADPLDSLCATYAPQRLATLTGAS